MAGFVFIGDEATCTGFRLAGIETHMPTLDGTSETFSAALSDADLVIITAEYAKHLPHAELEAAMAAESPAVVVIPDLRERETPPSLTAGIRETLGIET
jgi:vacuolar-type H+-ATPase subunit F/Vma7